MPIEFPAARALIHRRGRQQAEEDEEKDERAALTRVGDRPASRGGVGDLRLA